MGTKKEREKNVAQRRRRSHHDVIFTKTGMKPTIAAVVQLNKIPFVGTKPSASGVLLSG
jgi:hypothetical protein